MGRGKYYFLLFRLLFVLTLVYTDEKAPEGEIMCHRRFQNGVRIKDLRDESNGARFEFHCHKNYTLIGNKTSLCVNGEWDVEPNARCIHKDCTNNSLRYNLKNGKVADKYFGNQVVLVKYDCDKNYKLIGRESSICHDGKWTEDLPKCESIFEKNVDKNSTNSKS